MTGDPSKAEYSICSSCQPRLSQILDDMTQHISKEISLLRVNSAGLLDEGVSSAKIQPFPRVLGGLFKRILSDLDRGALALIRAYCADLLAFTETINYKTRGSGRLIEGIEEIIFDEGMRMLAQLGEDSFLRKGLASHVKAWPRTADFVGSDGGEALNDHSEPTLTEAAESVPAKQRSNRFLSSKSLEKKQRELKDIFGKGGKEESNASSRGSKFKMPEFITTESDFGRTEEKESLGKLSLANISNIKQGVEHTMGFFTSDMGAQQMEQNIELLGDMLPEARPKKVFRKKKLKRTGELKKEASTSKSRKRRQATNSAKKKKAKKRPKKTPKGSPQTKMVKSQSISLLSGGRLTRQKGEAAVQSAKQDKAAREEID